MKLVVGVNSYMTLEEANEIVADNFMSTDNKRVYWNNLEDDNDKNILIYKATELIDKDSMLYIGRKAEASQAMQFPRVIGSNIIECPKDIKEGIVMLALNNAVQSTNSHLQLIESGITSWSDGAGASEHYVTKSELAKNKVGAIDKEIFKEYFQDYTMICG